MAAGRKSKLTPEQWEAAAIRITDGETNRAVAQSYGIDESALRKGIAKVRELADRIALTDLSAKKNAHDLAQLPIPQQRTVNKLATRLLSISEHLASAAEYGAMTAHRLNSLAHKVSDKIDQVDPLSGESQPALAGVALLTKMANESAGIGLNLLKANKGTVESHVEQDQCSGAIDYSKLSVPELETLRRLAEKVKPGITVEG